VDGADGVRRLTGVPGERASDDGPWSAAFLWNEPPVPFEAAEMELGGGLSAELPAPGTSDKTIAIRGTTRSPADMLNLQVALLAAQEEAREAQAAHRQILQELARARDDLEAERSDRASDAERFKEGLGQVRQAGEQAVTTAEGEVGVLRRRLSELESELEGVAALRDELRTAKSQAADLSRQLEEAKNVLERAQAEADEADRLRSRLDAVRHALDDGT
jgi:DNA repair exonuclease SbcCD ATPase subunit